MEYVVATEYFRLDSLEQLDRWHDEEEPNLLN